MTWSVNCRTSARLADAGPALDEHCDRARAVDVRERLLQHARARRTGRRTAADAIDVTDGRLSALSFALAEPALHLAPERPLARIGAQQLGAQRIEIGWHVRRRASTREADRCRCLFMHDGERGLAIVRTATRQRFVKDHADAEPVGCRSDVGSRACSGAMYIGVPTIVWLR